MFSRPKPRQLKPRPLKPKPPMTGARAWLPVLLLLSLNLGPESAAKAAADGMAGEIAALITAAQGNYPAAQLTQMCVNVSQPKATPAQSLALVQKVGATCVRADNNWASIERVGSAGSYDWSLADDFWSTLCQAKIRPIMIATYNNPIYAAGVLRPITGNVNIAGFKNFAVAMANHYVELCPHMAEELFNEPSGVNWTTTPWSGSSYAMMLAPVSAAIKAAQPRVSVYSGGIGLDYKAPSVWITQMVSAGLRFQAVDAYGLHPYGYDVPPPGTPAPEQLLIDASRFARDTASTGQGKPVALTEYGFSLKIAGGDMRKQAMYVARGMLSAIIGRYPLLVHYDLIDDGSDAADPENTYGLFRDGSHKVPFEIKPAGLAYTAITSAMANAKSFGVSFDVANSASAVSFDKGRIKILVIWTYDASGTKSYAQPIGAFRQVNCKDVLGKAYACAYVNGTLSLSLSEALGPVIVTAVK